MFVEDDDGFPPFYGLEDWNSLPDLMGRRRRRFMSIFPEFQAIDQMIQDMNEMVSQMGNPFDLPQGIPPELVRKKKLPDGTEIQEIGPVVIGYSITMDENGQPVVRQFGNVNPNQPSPLKAIQDKREPLIDIINEGETVKVIAELAGVKKEEITILVEDDGKIIIETTGDRKYHKELKMPVAVDGQSGVSTYQNGILSLTLKVAAPPKAKGRQIKVD